MKLLKTIIFTIVFALTSLLVNVSASKTTPAAPLAPGYGALNYPLPEVGSYSLPAFKDAPDGLVLDDQGTSRSLHDLFKGKYTLLSFIYSTCKDVNGCPLANYVFYKLKARMRDDDELADKLRLVSLSFDPERDTPEVMSLFSANFKYAGNQGEWKFLTSPSFEALQPILMSYNQDIQREMSINGEDQGDISHILRVFLIDPELKIRNIYSVGFLHADVILNDLKTLWAEASDSNSKALNVASKKQALSSQSMSLLSKPGDVKDGYESASYTTQSKALTKRRGRNANLIAMANRPPLGLPAIPAPKSNPLSAEKITLGRKLFFDRRLSLNDTFSCAMCHVPEQGFTSNELAMAVGIEGRSVRRNSPTIYNIAYATKLFHDGRENSLEQQIWGPLLANNEMANPSVGYVINKIRKMPDYAGMFEKAFDGEGVNMRTLSQAIASYERSLVSADSPFDRWYFGEQAGALNEKAKRGFELFKGKAGCASCHAVAADYALFTDNNMYNTGIGYQESMGIKPKTQRVVLAPGVFVDVDTDIIDSVGEKAPADLGLYEVTQSPYDLWKYRTPSLRNISLTAPYMHNGSLQTLEDVVRFYNAGGIKNELLDSRIRPLGLDDNEIDDLVSFLNALTGSNVDILVADAFAAPIGDTTHNDPNWAHNTRLMND